jgi:hypothetical protein
LDTRHRKIDTGNIGNKKQKNRYGMLHLSIFLCLVSNVTCICLSVSCVQCCPCLSFCVLCSMLPVSIFLCLVSNVTRMCRSVSCVQCYPCLSFCVLCPMLPLSVFLCLKQDTERQIRVTLDTRHRKIDTGNIGHKTQNDSHVSHWVQDTE